jgi:acyl-CoA synthetase (NDP forming)
MEMLLPLGHALIEHPPMRGKRVGIATMGGSWGVVLSDALEECGLCVPELSLELQASLRGLGMPTRASTRNPVDIGASGLYLDVTAMVAIGQTMLASGEVDALVLHGLGRPGMSGPDTSDSARIFMEIEKQVIIGYHDLEHRYGIPVVIGNPFSIWESQVVADLNQVGIRTVGRIDDIAHLLRILFLTGTREDV